MAAAVPYAPRRRRRAGLRGRRSAARYGISQARYGPCAATYPGHWAPATRRPAWWPGWFEVHRRPRRTPRRALRPFGGRRVRRRPGPLLSSAECTSGGDAIHTGTVIVPSDPLTVMKTVFINIGCQGTVITGRGQPVRRPMLGNFRSLSSRPTTGGGSAGNDRLAGCRAVSWLTRSRSTRGAGDQIGLLRGERVGR